MMNDDDADLARVRDYYAREIAAQIHARSAGLIAALASIRREQFLFPGPWLIPFSDAERFGGLSYRTTPDADPRHVYHNVLVALDPARELNNGQPSTLAWWIDALGLEEGGRALHLGCGTGYYSAIMAHMLGSSGSVVAVEADSALAAHAARALATFPNVSVCHGHHATFPEASFDAVLINAGMTNPELVWLQSLRDGGRLLVPITIEQPGSRAGAGIMLRVRRAGNRFAARVVSTVSIFSSVSGRRAHLEQQLRTLLPMGGWRQVQSARVDPHEKQSTCWLHDEDVCVSSAAV